MNALRQRGLISFPAETHSEKRVSLKLARLDTSKSCDSHAIVMKKEWHGNARPETGVRAQAMK